MGALRQQQDLKDLHQQSSMGLQEPRGINLTEQILHVATKRAPLFACCKPRASATRIQGGQ